MSRAEALARLSRVYSSSPNVPRRGRLLRAFFAGILSLGVLRDSQETFSFLRKSVLGRDDSTVRSDYSQAAADLARALEELRDVALLVDQVEVERMRAHLDALRKEVREAQQKSADYAHDVDMVIGHDGGRQGSSSELPLGHSCHG